MPQGKRGADAGRAPVDVCLPGLVGQGGLNSVGQKVKMRPG